MLRGLLLDFYGTVVEDDDAIIGAIAARVAAGAASPVTGTQVSAAWRSEFIAMADAPGFHPLRECAVRSLAAVLADLGCPGDPAVLCAPQSPQQGQPVRAPRRRHRHGQQRTSAGGQPSANGVQPP